MSAERKAQKMTDTANAIDLGDRVAFWLRSSGYSAKQVARVIDASEATGKRLRAGFPPTTEQMTALSRHFGWRFVNFVYEAIIGPPAHVLDAEFEMLKARVEALEGQG